MYFIPKTYECPKCKTRFEYSQSVTYPFQPIDYYSKKPFCSKCLNDFIRKNVPIMEEIDD